MAKVILELIRRGRIVEDRLCVMFVEEGGEQTPPAF